MGEGRIRIMRGVIVVALLASLAIAVAAGGDRQINMDTKGERIFSSDVVNFVEPFRRDLGQKFNHYDDGAGCNCAKDAVLDLNHAFHDVMQHVPFVTLALLEEFTNKEGDQIGELEFNPLELYIEVTCIATLLVQYARQIMIQIDCNFCGIDGYYTGTTTYLPERDLRRDGHHGGKNTITPYEGISHYECCCGVFAIRDVVISRIREMYNLHLLNPGAEMFTDVSLYYLFHATIEAIDLAAKPYFQQHYAFPVAVPDISGCQDPCPSITTAMPMPG